MGAGMYLQDLKGQPVGRHLLLDEPFGDPGGEFLLSQCLRGQVDEEVELTAQVTLFDQGYDGVFYDPVARRRPSTFGI